MAIYEIARIQLRRGRTNSGTGVPQLASGEMAWAIDTQELFIGNGAISEGAPSVGNTRILTEADLNGYGFFGESCINTSVAQWQTNTNYVRGQIVANSISNLNEETYTYTFLCIENHTSGDFSDDLDANKWTRTPYVFTYKKPDVITGPNINEPVVRCIEDRLSDRVSLLDFVTINDAKSGDYSAALARAIENLFNNEQNIHKAYNDATYRVKLEIPAGIYNLDSTIVIPSYATIIGAGSNKTIFNFTNSGPVFKFLGDPINQQPKYINISGISININNSAIKNYPIIQLESVSNSKFNDISINDNWNGVYNYDNEYEKNHSGFLLTGISDIVTCEFNTFTNINITGVGIGFISDRTIKNNIFENVSISDSKYGFMLGKEPEENDLGYELKNNIINNCSFNGIHIQAIFIRSGYNNTVSNCKFINVGNNTSGTTETIPIYPQVYFNTANNSYQNNHSERTIWLSQPTTQHLFIPELSGKSVNYSTHGSYVIDNDLTLTNEPLLVIKLPVRTNESGTLEKIFNCRIEYNYETELPIEAENNFIRRGTMTIVADYDKLTEDFIQLIDELDYLGVSEEDILKVRFSARFIDTGIGIFYSDALNSTESLSSVLTYTYTINY